MISTSTQENSELRLMDELYKLADAGASLIQIRTREPIRTALVLRKNIVNSEDAMYREWDTVNGFRSFTAQNYVDHRTTGDKSDFMTALMEPIEQLRLPSSMCNGHKDKIHYYAYIDPHPYIPNNAYAIEMFQQYAAILPTSNICILLITPEISLDMVPSGTILTTEMSTPSAEELQDVLERIIEKSAQDFENGSELDDDELKKISYLGLGLSLFEFETYAAISIIEAGARERSAITFDDLSEGIAKGKTEVVKQSDILELTPSTSMGDVGGMLRLKDWVASRANCYSDEAKAFGIEPPKGIVVVGVPGTGKSLVARATASELGVPLVKMDFSRVFSKYIGDSESRIRSALKMVEEMAPVVLFLDELDKGLGGSGGDGGDSGTSSRVLGTFLSWLQDCKAPVFVMVTANRVNGLPPELLRRGRFDQIFSVSMPGPMERLEILEIHLRKRKKKLAMTNPETLAFTTASEGYVPAEIESAVKDGLIAAFNAKETLSMGHIVDALGEMIPMSKSNKEQIDRIVAWAADNATPAHYDSVPLAAGLVPGQALPRRVGRRSRT